MLIFIWTGSVRSGPGFGGAALGLLLMLFIDPNPQLMSAFAVLNTHYAIMRNDQSFKRWVGGGLMMVSILGLWKLMMQ